MIYKTKVRHDAFSFSLAGISAVAPYVGPPIVASDRITKARNARQDDGASEKPAPAQGAGKHRRSWFQRVGSRLAWGSAGS